MYGSSEVDDLVKQWKAQGLSKSEIIVKTAEAEIGWPYVWGAVGAICSPEKRQYYANRSSCPEGESKVIISGCQALNGSGKYCGGCQFYPNQMRTLIDDCQGFAKQVMSRVGITLSGGGCTSMWNNNSNWLEKGTIDKLPADKVCLAFQWSTKNSNMQHVGIYIGGGNIIECSGTVKRSTTAKKAWTHYAIPKGIDGELPVDKPTLRIGSTGEYVVECQEDLLKLGYDLSPYGADGKYGKKTSAQVKQFQEDYDVKPYDGICGQKTWIALDEAVKKPTKLYTVHIPHLTESQAESIIRSYSGAWKTEE